jgi:signal peptidase II
VTVAAPGTGGAGRVAAGGPLFAGKGWFWLPIAPLVALDLWSKYLVFGWLERLHPGMLHAEEEVWSGPISFSLVRWTNTGTIWGLGQDLTGALIALRCAALVALVWFAWRTPARARWQLLVLGLILAGALGNLYDNFTQPRGAVRDFLLFFVGSGSDRTVFPAFNVADSCITVGAIGLLATMFRQERASLGSAERVS